MLISVEAHWDAFPVQKYCCPASFCLWFPVNLLNNLTVLLSEPISFKHLNDFCEALSWMLDKSLDTASYVPFSYYFCNLIKQSNQSSLSQFASFGYSVIASVERMVEFSAWIEVGLFRWELLGLLWFLPGQTGITVWVLKRGKAHTWQAALCYVMSKGAVMVLSPSCYADMDAVGTMLWLSMCPPSLLHCAYPCPTRSNWSNSFCSLLFSEYLICKSLVFDLHFQVPQQYTYDVLKHFSEAKGLFKCLKELWFARTNKICSGLKLTVWWTSD